MTYQAVFKRYELKYLLNPAQHEAVMRAMEGRMALDSYGATPIHNVYYDTPDFILARRSIEHPLYKEKLRVRSYGPAGPGDEVFVEIKKKYDGVVYKRRLTMPSEDASEWLAGSGRPPEETQISREVDYMLTYYRNISPTMGLDYVRRAFRPVDEEDFRVTIDDGITASCDDVSLERDSYGFDLLPDGYRLMEVKTPGSIPLWMTRVMCENGIVKASFSKYGNAYKQMIMGKTIYETTGLETSSKETALS